MKDDKVIYDIVHGLVVGEKDKKSIIEGLRSFRSDLYLRLAGFLNYTRAFLAPLENRHHIYNSLPNLSCASACS